MYNTGKILVLAYPDTFVKHSTEGVCKLLPYIGIGTKTHIKAGHAALILIENKTGIARYFDFGRYVTPPGFGRVRSAATDAELEIPFTAQLNSKKQLINLADFLLWLDAHPEKTHGDGRLVASVCDEIDFEKALSFIYEQQQKGHIPYGAFNKNGTNCSRFVTQVISHSTANKNIRKALRQNQRFTPSTVGAVEKASNECVYQVYKQQISVYNGSALRENLVNFFDKKYLPKKKRPVNKPSTHAQLLTGTGSNAWFELSFLGIPEFCRIKRYNEKGRKDFDGVFIIPKGFNSALPYLFSYPSHCKTCTLTQHGQAFSFSFIKKYSAFFTTQKERLA